MTTPAPLPEGPAVFITRLNNVSSFERWSRAELSTGGTHLSPMFLRALRLVLLAFYVVLPTFLPPGFLKFFVPLHLFMLSHWH